MPLQAVIFDLGGVLLDRAWWRAIKYMPLLHLALYSLQTGQGRAGLLRDFFRVLRSVDNSSSEVEDSETLSSIDSFVNADGDLVLPPLMDEWMATGLPMSLEELRHRVQCSITRHPVPNSSTSSTVRTVKRCCPVFPCLPLASISRAMIMDRMVQLTFHPQLLAACMAEVKEGWKLLKALQCRLKECRFYLLSNFNREAFDEGVRVKFPHLVSSFDGVLLSHDVGRVKPDPKVLGEALRRWGLDPGRVVFLDDVGVNVRGARQLGVNARRFEKSRVGELLEDIVSLDQSVDDSPT